MITKGTSRKLKAILSADVKEYSRLMSQDEVGTIRTLNAYKEAMSALIEQYKGRVVDAPGDNLLAEFGSVSDAVNCSVEIQRELAERNEELPYNRKMEFRIGINLGDVVEEEGRIYGDGVNIAARVEALAEGGGICISGTVYDQVKDKLGLEYEYLGEQTVKNIPDPVRVYRVLSFPGAVAHRVVQAKEALVKKWRNLAIAAGAAVVVVVVAVGIWYFFMRPTQSTIEAASVEKMAFPLPEKPSIAVLAFDNLSGDPEQDYLADGISENIISTLSKLPQLFVIARNSTFTYKGKSVKTAQVSEELGVRYVLEGSVQKSGDRLRITAQLIDATKGHHLWSETYDRDLTDLFIIMDEITLEIAKALSVELMTWRKADTENLEAWTLFWKAWHHLERTSKEDNAKARDLLERTIELDPNWAFPRSALANSYVQAGRYRWSSSRIESFKKAKELALESLEMDDSHYYAHTVLGDIYLYERRYDEALVECEKAVDLDPNDAGAYYWWGRALNFSGQPDKTIPVLKKGMRLHPHYPWYFLGPLVKAYYHAGRYEDALAESEKMLQICKEGGGSMKWPHLMLSMVYVELGQMEEARAHMQKVLEYDPNFNIEARRKASPYKDPALNERELAAHRKAGAPEHPPSK